MIFDSGLRKTPVGFTPPGPPLGYFTTENGKRGGT